MSAQGRVGSCLQAKIWISSLHAMISDSSEFSPSPTSIQASKTSQSDYAQVTQFKFD